MTATQACAIPDHVVSRLGDFAVARLATTVRECVQCSGTGLVRGSVFENGRHYEVALPCARALKERRVLAFNHARLPAVHANARFDNFKSAFEEQKQALECAKSFAFTYVPAVTREREHLAPPRGFIVSGPVGTGKSHLLCATLAHLSLEKGISVQYVEISLLYKEIRRGFQEGRSGGEIIQPLAQVEVLAIDELARGRGSAFELDTLDELIARRYNAGRVTLFATNYSLRPPEDRFQRGHVGTESLVEATKESQFVVDRVGDRIYSRLQEMCDFISFSPRTPDVRRTKVVEGAGPSRRAPGSR